MIFYEIPDYIEKNKLFPKIKKNFFQRFDTYDVRSFARLRYDTNINLSKDILNRINFNIINEICDYDQFDSIPAFENIIRMEEPFNYYIVEENRWFIDKIIYDYINSGNICNVKCSIYYKDDSIINIPKKFYVSLKKNDMPKLEISSLGNTYSYFENERVDVVDETILCFKNMAFEEFNDKCLHPYNQLSYIINNKKWASTDNKIGYMEKMLIDFSHNGFNNPLCLKRVNNKYYPIACNTKALSAIYLKMPIIPVCIIEDKYDVKMVWEK